MQPVLALLHTAPMLIEVFGALCRKELPDVQIYHMLDESLLKNTLAAGRLQTATIRRVVRFAEGAAESGAAAMLVTCSTIGPAVNAARLLLDMPVVRVDEPMAEEAVRTGARIGVAATLASTLSPTCQLLEDTAEWMKRQVNLTPVLVKGAFDAVSAGDPETHDALIRDALIGLAAETDVIVLAQASMARAAGSLQVPVPVLSSPALAVARAGEVIRREMANA